MPRKQLVRSADYPYHITSRSNNREWFYIASSDVWLFAQKLLTEAKERFSVEVEAFVLMNNHYHLLIRTPNANVDQVMHFFNKNLGQAIARQAGRINRIFGASYKWNLIVSQSYFLNVKRYIYQNPIRAGLTARCEDYPYSDLSDKIKSGDVEKHMLDWFNARVSEWEQERTKKKLRRYFIGEKTLLALLKI